VKRLLTYWIGSFQGLPRMVWFLALVTFINRAGTMILPFIALYATRELGMRESRTGWIIGCYGAGAIVGSYLGGWLADRLGDLRVVLMSLFWAGIVMLTLPYLRDPLALAGGIFLTGLVGEAYRPGANAATVASCPPEARQRAFALIRLAINIGMVFGPAIGGMLAMHDYAWIFRVDGLTCLAASALVFFAVPASRRGIHTEPAPGEPAVTEAGGPFRDPLFLYYILLSIISGAIIFQAFSTYPLYLESVYGLTEFDYGLVMGINGVMIVLFEMILTRIVERRRTTRVIAVGVLFTAAGMAVLPLGSGFSFAVLSVVIWTVGEMLESPAKLALAAGMAGEGQRGRYLGLFHVSYGFAFLIGPVVGSFVYERFGPNTLWFGVGVVGVLLAIAYATMGTHPVERAVSNEG